MLLVNSNNTGLPYLGNPAFNCGKPANEFIVKRLSILFVMLAVLLTFGLVFASCDSEGDSGRGGASSNSIVGTWKAETSVYSATLILMSDLSYSLQRNWIAGIVYGTYSVNEDSIILWDDAGVLDIGTINGNSIHILGADFTRS